MGRGLDAHAGHGAPERDGLQLRNDGGHRAAREAGVGERLVGHHAFGVDHARALVDAEHVIERARVEAAAAARRIAEEVRSPFAEGGRPAGDLRRERRGAQRVVREGRAHRPAPATARRSRAGACGA